MPIHEARDEQTGKTIKFEWLADQPPTEADLAEVFAAAEAQAPTTHAPHSMGGFFSGLGDRLAEGVKSVISGLTGPSGMPTDPRVSPTRSTDVSSRAFAAAKAIPARALDYRPWGEVPGTGYSPLAETAYHGPLGMALDVGALAAGGEGLALRAGLPTAAKVLRGVSRVNPVNAALAGVGRGAEVAAPALGRQAESLMAKGQKVPLNLINENPNINFAQAQLAAKVPINRTGLEEVGARIGALNQAMGPALEHATATFQPSLKNMPQTKGVLRGARRFTTESGYPEKRTAISNRVREVFAPLREPTYGPKPVPTQTGSAFGTQPILREERSLTVDVPGMSSQSTTLAANRVTPRTGTAFTSDQPYTTTLEPLPTPARTRTGFETPPLTAGATPLPTVPQTVQQAGRIPMGTQPKTLSARQMQDLKKAVDERLEASWGQSTEGRPSVAIDRAIRSDITAQLGTAVPEVQNINQQLTQLYPLQDLMRHRVPMIERAAPLPMSAGIGAMLTHGAKVSTQLLGALAGKAVNNPELLSKVALRMSAAGDRLAPLAKTVKALEPAANMATFARHVTQTPPTPEEARRNGQIVSQAVDEFIAQAGPTTSPQDLAKGVRQVVEDTALLTGGVADVTRRKDRATTDLVRELWASHTTEAP